MLNTMSCELSEGYGKTETKKITVDCCDLYGNLWPVIVDYTITDYLVMVSNISLIEAEYSDIKYDIIAAIEKEEGRNLTVEFI